MSSASISIHFLLFRMWNINILTVCKEVFTALCIAYAAFAMKLIIIAVAVIIIILSAIVERSGVKQHFAFVRCVKLCQQTLHKVAVALLKSTLSRMCVCVCVRVCE